MCQYLVKNGQAIAHVVGHTDLKSVRASVQWAEDALNAEFPAVLVNAREYKISSAQKHQGVALDAYAKPLDGGRQGDFLIY